MKLSQLLSNYHTQLVNDFRAQERRENDRRRVRTYTASEVIVTINNHFQPLLLNVLHIEREDTTLST